VRRSTLMLAAAISLVAGTSNAESADTIPPAVRTCARVKENLERLACYDKAVELAELTSLTARVKALSHDATGALLIDLENGQQWLQLSGSSSPLLEVGHEVTITRAALNSFRMTTPSGRALKVKRVQ
jgi:hypothetical protein